MTERGLDLTVAHLLLESGYYVAILGHQPPFPINRAIGMLFETGAPVKLAPTLLRELWRYHQTQDSIRPWLLRSVDTR